MMLAPAIRSPGDVLNSLLDAEKRSGRVVLVVEDEVMIRLALGEALRDVGFTVIEAASADEALTVLLRHGPIDALVTDVRMPGSVDGIALAKRVKADWPGTRVIVSSGHADIRDVTEVADAFFRKPFDFAAVADVLRRVLSSNES